MHLIKHNSWACIKLQHVLALRCQPQAAFYSKGIDVKYDQLSTASPYWNDKNIKILIIHKADKHKIYYNAVVLNYMIVGCFKYKLVLHCLKQNTSHIQYGCNVSGSHRLRQPFICILHTEYKLLWACTWSSSISLSFNTITL